MWQHEAGEKQSKFPKQPKDISKAFKNCLLVEI